MAPEPFFKHQEVVTRLVRLISNYVYENAKNLIFLRFLHLKEVYS